MVEFAKRFIDKDCIIRTFNNSLVFTGVLKEVSENAILIENDNNTEIINLEYVINIKEHPKNKNGKKKSIYFWFKLNNKVIVNLKIKFTRNTNLCLYNRD